jgi:uncharacterized protein (DUF2336 family)
MQILAVDTILAGKDVGARSEIARRVGEHLCRDEPDSADRRAAEALARTLANDVIESVRRELSNSLRRARWLPRDIALRIAHDVDSVACPFLEVTEVFSETDWEQLVLTLSRSGLVAVARRAAMSERLALSLAELGDGIVAETLVDNPASPMTRSVCHTLMGRFDSEIWVLDRMAQRKDLVLEVVLGLIEKVSGAAREKLVCNYELPDHMGIVAAEAETNTLLKLMRETPLKALPDLAASLKRQGKLTENLLLTAIRENLLEFLAAALSSLAGMRLEQTRSILLRADTKVVMDVFKRCRIDEALHDDMWQALVAARKKH